MSAAQEAVAPLQTLGNATAQQNQKSAMGGATGCAAGSLKALAIKALWASSAQRPVQHGRNAGATNRATEAGNLLHPEQRLSGLSWPMPEPGPIDTSAPAGRYACLWAIATAYGARLTKDAEGRLTLAFPYTMPQEAAQAAKDGLAELAGYIGERLQ